MPSFAYPPPPSSVDATQGADLDKTVARLGERKSKWAQMPIQRKIAYLDGIIEGWQEITGELVSAYNQKKGLDPTHPAFNEEALAGSWAGMRNFVLLRSNLKRLAEDGVPYLPPNSIEQLPSGQTTVKLFPGNIWDRLLFAGMQGEVRMPEGIQPGDVRDHMASAIRNPDPQGAVSVVLGAGNVSSIAPMDSVYKLFVENQTVVLKMNPVNEYIGPLLRRAFRELVDDGFFEVVYGGAEVGKHLTTHDGVDNLHITGSDATHDAIVWGPREGREERKAAGTPVNSKPISSELGNITPTIVVPGKWTKRELDFHAWNVVTSVTNNASFNCAAGKLLVTSKHWPQRQEFLDRIRVAFATIPSRKAYYPGARDRWSVFREANPHAEIHSEDHPEVVPWTLIPSLNPGDTGNPSFTTEPFCAILSEVALDAKTPVEFLDQATAFCNDVVWGQLTAGIIIDPRVRKDPSVEAALRLSVQDLRYGTLGVNVWPAIPYAITALPWGAFPGNTLDQVGSGIGVVHNAYMFDRPEKGILEAPFTIFPKPPWYANHARAAKIGIRMTEFEASRSLLKVLPIALHAIRG